MSEKMTFFELQTYIEVVGKDTSILEENNFDKRLEVIDFIGYHIIDQIEAFLLNTDRTDMLHALKFRAEKLQSELEEIDITLFQRLQKSIQKQGITGQEFKNLIDEYVYISANHHDGLREETGNDQQESDYDYQESDCDYQETGYDNLDIFMNGLSPFQTMPEETINLEPDMVSYHKTPARIVLELVEKSHFTKEDVFFDLGAGLGQVAILVNLLTGIRTRGIELEPAFCNYARACAESLNLSDVLFINADARKTDYSEGTIFFMFTPFRGEIMDTVLENLRKESLLRKITIITYGPCTVQVALQSWLVYTAPVESHDYKLGFFSSF
jgi:histone methylation protein DOT1